MLLGAVYSSWLGNTGHDDLVEGKLSNVSAQIEAPLFLETDKRLNKEGLYFYHRL